MENQEKQIIMKIVIGYLYKRLYGSESLGKSDKHYPNSRCHFLCAALVVKLLTVQIKGSNTQF